MTIARKRLQSKIMHKAWDIRYEAAITMNCKVGEISMALCLYSAWQKLRDSVKELVKKGKHNLTTFLLNMVYKIYSPPQFEVLSDSDSDSDSDSIDRSKLYDFEQARLDKLEMDKIDWSESTFLKGE